MKRPRGPRYPPVDMPESEQRAIIEDVARVVAMIEDLARATRIVVRSRPLRSWERERLAAILDQLEAFRAVMAGLAAEPGSAAELRAFHDRALRELAAGRVRVD